MVLRGIAIATALLLVAQSGEAGAQGGDRGGGDGDDDGKGFVGLVSEWIQSFSEKTRDNVFQFLETVELFDVEAEIDRFVGDPWELNDATSYKLALLPVHIGYPTYQQLASQMTRIDDLRSRRVQNVTPDSVEVISLRFDSLTSTRYDGRPLTSGGTLASALVRHFNVREMADLSVFALSHQPFFPETAAGWQYYKHRIAQRGPALAVGAVALGAAFEAGTFAQSGTLKKWADDARLGWYGGFRRLGFRMQPLLRGGLTARLPGVEVAAGLAERIRPDEDARRRAVELAFREGWLGRLTAPSGWDLFVEGALRGVLAAGPRYQGEPMTGRAGLFVKRDAPLRLRHLVLRSSAEMESDFDAEVRFAVGFGLEHRRTGLATVLQSSRTAVVRDGTRTPETRGGVFLAGTMEPPMAFFVDAMHLRARLVRDEWEALAEIEQKLAGARLALAGGPSAAPGPAAVEALGRDMVAVEAHAARLATLLADYLESRRFAYSILRWERSAADLHGPLDGGVLARARGAVLGRLRALAALLEEAPRTLAPLRRRFFQVREAIERLEREGASGPTVDGYRAERADLDQAWRRASEQVGAALRAYAHYRDSARRMLAAAVRLAPAQDPDPVDRRTLARLNLLVAVSLR